MPASLPPASEGFVFFPHPLHVHQSVRSTCLAHTRLVHGLGWGSHVPTSEIRLCGGEGSYCF